jgi:hypothetical protein
MTRLDDYRSALLAAFADFSDAELAAVLETCGPNFVSFIIDHGLGPLWHERTARDEFRESRLAAEALYLAQEHTLKEIDAALDEEGIEYAIFKGAANRKLLHKNPAIRGVPGRQGAGSIRDGGEGIHRNSRSAQHQSRIGALKGRSGCGPALGTAARGPTPQRHRSRYAQSTSSGKRSMDAEC